MSKKLLLADDSITIQKVIGITFANEEYDLTIVDNGAIALEKARAERPDLILSDVFMPGKNGYELTAAVKQDPGLNGVPVLLLAGTFEPFDEDKARNSGADGWISKPFESQALIDRVEELLTRSAAAAPAQEAAVEVPAAEMPSAGREERQPAEWEEIGLDQEPASDDDDLWGAVSFAEEDLGEEAEELEEESFAFEEEAFELAEAAPEISVADEEEDFLVADEPLEGSDAPAEKPSFPLEEEEPFMFEGEPLDLAEESPADQWVGAAAEEEDFVFDEDPLELMEEPPAGDQIPEGKTATANEGVPFEWESEPAAAESATAWEESEEEIFTLEEADILEEEELEIESLVSPASLPEKETLEWEEGAETFAADEDIFAASEPAIAAGPADQEEFFLSEEEPEWGIAEPEAEGEEPFAFDEEGVLPEPASQPAPAPVASESVAGQVQALSEEDLSRVVEKVAGTVIERLAATVLEKIAWEVVPDLAESMIRDELRRLKGEG